MKIYSFFCGPSHLFSYLSIYLSIYKRYVYIFTCVGTYAYVSVYSFSCIYYLHVSVYLSLFRSSSKVHPQTEDYRGNVNTIGPRACYDEAKRMAETMCYAYEKQVSFAHLFPLRICFLCAFSLCLLSLPLCLLLCGFLCLCLYLSV